MALQVRGEALLLLSNLRSCLTLLLLLGHVAVCSFRWGRCAIGRAFSSSWAILLKLPQLRCHTYSTFGSWSWLRLWLLTCNSNRLLVLVDMSSPTTGPWTRFWCHPDWRLLLRLILLLFVTTIRLLLLSTIARVATVSFSHRSRGRFVVSWLLQSLVSRVCTLDHLCGAGRRVICYLTTSGNMGSTSLSLRAPSSSLGLRTSRWL